MIDLEKDLKNEIISDTNVKFRRNIFFFKFCYREQNLFNPDSRETCSREGKPCTVYEHPCFTPLNTEFIVKALFTQDILAHNIAIKRYCNI
jgi:hypothetical protein